MSCATDVVLLYVMKTIAALLIRAASRHRVSLQNYI